MKVPGTLFVVSAPSGAGKTTLVNGVLDSLKDSHALSRVVTYTTRAPRGLEVNGVDYHYITVAEFERLINEGFFLDWSNAYGNYYGAPCTILEDLEQGKNLILIPDRIGAQKIMAFFSLYIYKVITIWVEAPSLSILEQRLRSRGQDTPEQIAKRMVLAAYEITQEAEFPLYSHKIVNDNYEISLKNLELLIKNALILKEKKQIKSGSGIAEKSL